MSSNRLEMLPPDIEAQPNPEFCCPFCGVELTVEFADLYRAVIRWTSIHKTPERRVEGLRSAAFRFECPECHKLHDISLEPEISVKWRAVATPPRPGAIIIDGMVYGGRPVEAAPTRTLSLPTEVTP